MQAELDIRIRQLHEALWQVRSTDISNVRPQVGVAGNSYYAVVNFSVDTSDAQLANMVSLCIHNIARLKDHLKEWCKARQKPFHGDTLVNSNLDVGLIHDLWNRDKHFDLRDSRTGLFPEVHNISKSLRLTTGPQGSKIGITLDPKTGQMKTVGDGKVELVIDADVLVKDGLRIGGLLETAERAADAWETALAAAGVIIPARQRTI